MTGSSAVGPSRCCGIDPSTDAVHVLQLLLAHVHGFEELLELLGQLLARIVELAAADRLA